MAESHDWISAEFADLSSRAAPQVRPPGISAAVETVRRRRIRNRAWSAAIAAVVVMALAAGVWVLPGSRGEPPIDRVTPSPSPAPSQVVSPEPVQPIGASPEAPVSPTKSPCSQSLVFRSIRRTPGPGWIEVTYTLRAGPRPYCPDALFHLHWVSYSGDWQGNMRLHRSMQDIIFDARMYETTIRIELPGTCGDAWYVVQQNVTLRSSFQRPPGQANYQPYPGSTLDFGERSDCVSPTPTP